MASLYDQILLLGDSITEFSTSQDAGFNFTPALQNGTLSSVKKNHLFSACAPTLSLLVFVDTAIGYNTELTLRILSSVIPSPNVTRVRFLVVFLGANDACFPQETDNQCVPLPEYKKNLIKIVQHPSVVAQDPKIIFISPPPVQECKQRYLDDTTEKGPKRTAVNTMKYADAVRDRGKELGIPVLDLWTAFAMKAGWKPGNPPPGSMDDNNPVLNELLIDGLHLAPAGYRVLYDEFMKLMEHEWPEQMPDKLSFPLPVWNDEDAWRRWRL